MPYVKPTVHISRLASTALKTFTHGYAQTVVAASQSSYAAQNTSAAPIADHLIARFRKSEKSRLQNVYTHVDGTRQAGTAGLATGRGDATQDGLEKYFDAWQKHQRNGGTKEWQQFQFARRLEWQPPTTVPAQQSELYDAEELVPRQEQEEELAATSLKRSYTTSALDIFGKAFLNDEGAEAAALEQVNIAIAEEIQRCKSPSATSVKDSALASGIGSGRINSEILDNADSLESDYYTNQLLQLSESRQYGDIPAVFQGMLRAGVKQPSPSAYRTLLIAAIELTHGKHLKAPKALEVYSDMLRRKVVPDVETYGMLIALLSTRASEAMTMRKSLAERLSRYGGLDEAGKFMFRSTQSEYAMLVEDKSLSIALNMFERAKQTSDVVPIDACASLVIASAEQGRVDDMTRVYQYMESKFSKPSSIIYPPMIAAFGAHGDLRNAVEVYDEYKELAIANNAGENAIIRVDYQIYAAIIKAYGAADRLKGGLKFLASVQSEVANTSELEKLREVVALDALLPLALKDATFRDAINLTGSLTGRALTSALARISIDAADRNVPHISLQAFDNLARHSVDLTAPSMAVLAMHIRNANVEAAEPFWRILESAPPTLDFIEPSTMRTVALIGIGQSERGLRQSRRMFARLRESQSGSVEEMHDQIGEAIELMGTFMLKQNNVQLPEASVELLRMMVENGGLVAPISDHLVARFNPEHIARLNQADLELLLRVQSSMILDEMSADIAGPARFGCLLETLVSRSMMPFPETETVIERTLINIDRAELSKMWNNYRYPAVPAQAVFAPVGVSFQAPTSAEETYDPYLNRTDVKASNTISELLDRQHGRGTNEAFVKFRNMRRIGRVPRMFIYGKLIEAAAKENKLNLAHDILEMAKSDVPFDARYRLVRFGWQQILDHMVAGCLNVGRRDLASRYHQDMTDMGCAPSANTFGLYITTLKENTKTFDEASEAVKIFLRAKGEGVEPSSFLYNALIGKLGKARRIDDCLFYFAEMRNTGVRPTSVTYGTIVNALCRVSDDKFAEEIFEEMESCANYKPRPAPYHSLMQFFLSTKRDRGKVLAYYERMLRKGIEPTIHTYKLLIDTHATLEPVNMPAAEQILEDMHASGIKPEAVHYSSLIHAKGCVQHDMDAALALFNRVLAESVRPLPCMYQAVFESLNANHRSGESEALVEDMRRRNVEVTPYVANALIHGWTAEGETAKAESIFRNLPISRREPSTYEAMVRAYLAGGERQKAHGVVKEALGRGYPGAVAGKIAELLR